MGRNKTIVPGARTLRSFLGCVTDLKGRYKADHEKTEVRCIGML